MSTVALLVVVVTAVLIIPLIVRGNYARVGLLLLAGALLTSIFTRL